MQRDLFFAATAALGRLTPAVWGSLTARERDKISCIMEGLLYSSWYQNSDLNPWANNNPQQRRIDGHAWGRNRNFNFSHPSFMMPYIVGGFFGSLQTARNMCNSFVRATFAAKCQSLDLWELWDTFRRNHTTATPGLQSAFVGPGPTASQLETAVRGQLSLGRRIESAADCQSWTIAEINRMWSRTIQQGIGPGYSGSVPQGFTKPPAGVYGLFEPNNISVAPHTNLGRNAYVARLTDMSKWSIWQAEGLAGTVGAPFELSSSDGGGGNSGGPRSDMQYATDGAMLCLVTTTVLAAQGLLPRSNAALRAAFQRQGRGARHCQLLGIHGYRGFAKGGRPWVGTNRNADWINGSSQEQSYRSQALWALWHEVLRPWHDAA